MAADARSEHLSPLQLRTSRRAFPPVPAVCAVTGGTGFVGGRLVEMLVERGARKVRVLDIVPPPKNAWADPRIEYIVGDICDLATVERLVNGVDCVWHNAAAVGPFHPVKLYFKVNHEGTLNVIKACKKAGVKKVVMSSSPSTRFDGSDVDGLTEDAMPKLPQPRYLQTYAETKALGEKAMTDACTDDFMTIAVAPHQVYGPRDNLFLPNLLESCGTNRLRVFGDGRNRICFTHVDNYAHGLIIAERALKPGSPALGKFYIVTDAQTHPHPEGYLYFWDVLEQASLAMGFASIKARTRLPLWLLKILAYICELIGFLTGLKLKLSLFNVRMLTMHRWFDTSAAKRDLGYEPIISFDDGWHDTLLWFKEFWLPSFDAKSGVTGLAEGTQNKIDIQSAGTS
ncbi:hypothetical protein AB1Y20_007905 [Prymnesium parvum]|uniref:3-beta hydroxysteroid dehydrogenase/isomerase domain-containing protein n=1 Tax=Prymnesium parvum TaxID=97485 RepID=A0AB34IUT4_PRYPA